MAPLNWDRIQNLDLEKLEENEAEEFYHELLSVKIDKETDVERLRSAFNLSRTIMELKASQAQVAFDELEQLAGEKAKIGADRENELLKEIDDLKLQLSNLRRQTADSNVSKEAQPLKDEIRFLTEENQRLERDFAELRRDLAHEKEVAGRYANRVENFEKEIRDLRKERDQLIEDVRESQRQLESQRESLSSRRAEGEDLQKKMRSRNQEMIALVDEVNNLTEANETMQKQVNELKASLEESVKQMEKTTDQYLRMKDALKETDEALEVLQNENVELQKKLSELGVRGPTQPTLEEELINAVDKKIEEWKVLFQEKERELANAKKQIEELQQDITQYQMDSDRMSTLALTKAVEQRDQNINALKSELQQYTIEMEKSALVMDELKSQLSMGGNITETQKQRMQEMQKNLRTKEQIASDANKRAGEAEAHALEKDKQMTDLLRRMRQYESKEFGLAEAVDELREYKIQLDLREKESEELVQHCGKLEIHVNELLDENEELRDRLGLDKLKPLSVTFKQTKRVQRETERALNVILQKEIERLEDERIDMKLQMRKLAQKLGERAVALGLSADDLMIIEQFAEDLKDKKKGRKGSERRPTSPQSETRNDKVVDDMGKENKSLRTKIAQLETENVKMLQGIKEIRSQLKEGQLTPGDGTVVTPTLDKLVAALEARELTGNIDAVMQMKSQLDTLTGRHEELRNELRQSRVELQKSQLILHDSEQRNVKLTEDMRKIKESAAEGYQFQGFALPPGVQPTSAMAIMNLNEHLIQMLQEVALKTDQLKKFEESVEIYRRKISVLKHQQSLLYKKHIEERTTWAVDKKHLEVKYKEIDEINQNAQIQIAQFQRLTDTLGQDENEIKRRLGEMTRKFTVMLINEKILVRKFNFGLETEKELRNDNEKLKRDFLDVENAIIEKVGYLERQKEMMSYQVASLHKAVESSVPQSDYESLSRQNVDLTEKYRMLMESHNRMISDQKSNALGELQSQEMAKENESLKRQLQTEKEKSNKLEILMEAGRLSGVGSPLNWTQMSVDTDSGLGSLSELHSVSQKLAMLEMKELNERQKAEHAQRISEQQKSQLRILDERNVELEQKFDKLTAIHSEVQKIEQNLRDELAGCVPKSVHEAEKEKAVHFEKVFMEQKLELEKLKEISDVAKFQYDYLQKNVNLQNVELNDLREFFRDVQAENDSKAAIGKLHREIVRLKLNETSAEMDLKNYKEKNHKLELLLRRSRQQTDEYRRSLDHFRIEFVHRVQQLRKTINELRQRFTGAVPLDEQEKFHQLLIKMKDERAQLNVELAKAVEKENLANDKLGELELKHVGLEELIGTIKENRGAEKLMEWHKSTEESRLGEMRAKRQATRLELQVAMQANVIGTLESTLSSLEVENVQLIKKWQEREMAWEQRENELENKLRNYEMEERYTDKEMEEVDPDVTSFFHGSLTMVEQVDMAIQTVKKHVHSEKVMRRELDSLRKELDTEKAEKKKLEAELFRKDRLILDLRKLIPENIARRFDEATFEHGLIVANAEETFERFDLQRASRILLETSEETFKARLAQKDEALENYRQLLKSFQADLSESRRLHQEEISRLLQEIGRLEAERMEKWRDDANKLAGSVEEATDMEKQLLRVAELEDTCSEQETRIGSLVESLREANIERDKLKSEIETLRSMVAVVLPGSVPHSKEGSKAGSVATKRPDSAATAHSERTHRTHRTTSLRDQSVIIIKEEPAEPDKEPMTDLAETKEEIVEEKVKSRRSSVASDDGRLSVISESTVTITKSVVVPVPPPPIHTESEALLKMKVKCQRLEKQLKEKTDENKKMENVIGALRADMINSAGQISKSRPESGMRDMELKDLKLKLEENDEKLAKAKKDLRKSKTKEEELNSDVQELKGEISRKDGIIGKLKSDKEKLEKEVTNLETRLSHLRDSVKMKIQETENVDLRKRLSELEKRMESEQKVIAEKPSDGSADKRSESLSRWEEVKTIQRKAERYKEKLVLVTKENEERQKLIVRLRDRITRLEQEKAFASGDPRFGSATSEGRESGTLTNVVSTQTSRMVENLDDAHFSELEELRMQVLKQRSFADKYASVEEENKHLKTRNQFLEEKCTLLEKRVQQISTTSTTVVAESTETTKISTTVLGPEDVDLNGKNTEELESIIEMLRRLLDTSYRERERYKMSYEMTKKEYDDEKQLGDNLRGRVRQLQEEVQSLREEVDEIREESEQTDKDYKYEIVNRLHTKVEELEIERIELLRQIDEIKLSSSRVSDVDMQKIIRENRQLKEKLARAAPRVAWSEELTGDQKIQPLHKLLNDNEKMRKDLRRSESEIVKVRRECEMLKMEKQKLQDDLRHAQSLIDQRRRWQPATIGQVERYTERSTEYEITLRRKTERLSEVENLLKLEIEKNQSLQFENKRLISKIKALEWTPTRDHSTDDLLYQIRQLKTELVRLEGEHVHLKDELEIFNRRIEPVISGRSDFDLAAFKERMKIYDRVLHENIDLKLENNGLKAKVNGNTDRSRF